MNKDIERLQKELQAKIENERETISDVLDRAKSFPINPIPRKENVTIWTKDHFIEESNYSGVR